MRSDLGDLQIHLVLSVGASWAIVNDFTMSGAFAGDKLPTSIEIVFKMGLGWIERGCEVLTLGGVIIVAEGAVAPSVAAVCRHTFVQGGGEANEAHDE